MITVSTYAPTPPYRGLHTGVAYI